MRISNSTADPKGEPLESTLEVRPNCSKTPWASAASPYWKLKNWPPWPICDAFVKGQMIFEQDQPCKYFHLVASGLVKVYICSASGYRMTYLLARRGEPLNLVGPFTGDPRFLCAEAMQTTEVAHIPRHDFVRFVADNPILFSNIMAILSKAVDSANSRLIDMVEKRVEERLLRVLLTLLDKFGSEIKLTSAGVGRVGRNHGGNHPAHHGSAAQLGHYRIGTGPDNHHPPRFLEKPRTPAPMGLKNFNRNHKALTGTKPPRVGAGRASAPFGGQL